MGARSKRKGTGKNSSPISSDLSASSAASNSMRFAPKTRSMSASASASTSISLSASRRSNCCCCCRGVCLSSGFIYLSFFIILLPLLYITWNHTITASGVPSSPPPPVPRFYSFELVNEFPHDPSAFTQGLVYGGNETLFESTGLYGKSSVRQVLLQSGKVMTHHQMDSMLFGEGLTLLGERLFQVTWMTRRGFIYDRSDLSKNKKFTHQMQDGWGLATDGKNIFGSDGSSTLYHIDPHNLKVYKKVTTKYDDREISFLNELEYINGEVWANIWQTDCIARISPENGAVSSWILLHELRKSLLKSGYTNIDVLNGIAWDEETNRLFVTGKLWPKLYEIKLRPVIGSPGGTIEDLCPIR